MMTWEEYSQRIKEFCIYPDVDTGNELELSYLSLGLASESGEVAGVMKKILRDQPEDFGAQQWLAELGDVVWYVTRILSTLNYTLEDCMEYNYAKLTSRKLRDQLKGSGDNR